MVGHGDIRSSASRGMNGVFFFGRRTREGVMEWDVSPGDTGWEGGRLGWGA